MSHPHSLLLLEFDLAVKKLPPTLPDLIASAKKKLKAFEADETLDEQTIQAAIAEIGRKEYPHRHALLELHHIHGEAVELALVLDHLDTSVAKKVRGMVDKGVSLEELVKSEWFVKELTPAERYQVEDGMLLARYKVEKEDKGLVQKHREEFDGLVKKWEEEAKKIDGLIEELESLAGKDPRYTDEIQSQVRAFRIGWSVVEPDPELEEVQKTLAYWKDVFESND